MLLNKVVVGSTLESLVYAFLNECYFLPNTPYTPIFYKEISPRILPTSRRDVSWSRLQLAMSLLGRLLNYPTLNSIKITEDIMKISTSEGLHKYKFEQCEIFDTTNVHLENAIKDYSPVKYIVYDDFEISNLGGKHRFLEPKKSEDSLAREIHFYTSDRVDGAEFVTDCVVESHLTHEEINDIEYSDSMTRFSVVRHLESIGILGNFMMNYKNGTPKYRKPKVIHKNRVVIKSEQNTYQDSDKVKFLNLSMKEIMHAASATRP